MSSVLELVSPTGAISPAHILAIPNEVLAKLLACSAPADIRRCRRVCRRFKELVDSSPEITYLLELDALGYVRGYPARDISFQEMIEVLRLHRKSWFLSDANGIVRYDESVLSPEPCICSCFCKGHYAKATGSPESMSWMFRRIEILQLPSRNRGTPLKSWVHEDLGVDMINFRIEPDFDLLVLLENTDAHRLTTAPETSLAKFYKIHIRSLKTQKPHPNAALPVLDYVYFGSQRLDCPCVMEIFGRLLAIVFHSSTENSPESIVVWDWTTGRKVTYADIFSPQDLSFTFISDEMFAITRGSNTSDGMGYFAAEPSEPTIGSIEVYQFDLEPREESPTRMAKHIASLDLPVVRWTAYPLLCMLPTNQPTVPSRLWENTGHTHPPKVYDHPENHQLLGIEISCMETTVHYGVLFTPVANLLATASSLPQSWTATRIPWDSWGQGCWVPPERLFAQAGCVGFGRRLVSHFDYYKKTIALVDFDPTRYETIRRCYPPHSGILKSNKELKGAQESSDMSDQEKMQHRINRAFKAGPKGLTIQAFRPSLAEDEYAGTLFMDDEYIVAEVDSSIFSYAL